MYGAVMGLAGLGLSARAAATVFPGFLRAPAYFTEPWVALGALLLAGLLPLYLLKLLRFPAAVREDFTNPTTLGFCGALPVGMTLVAGGLAPYAPALADALPANTKGSWRRASCQTGTEVSATSTAV